MVSSIVWQTFTFAACSIATWPQAALAQAKCHLWRANHGV